MTWFKRVLCAAIAFGFVAGFAAARSEAAVDPNEFEIVIPGQVLDRPLTLPERPDVRTVGQAEDGMTVLVGGVACVAANLANTAARNAEGNFVIRVGAPGQPQGCANEGARVTFVNRNGLTLNQEFIFRRGTSVILSNFAPKPLVEPGPGVIATAPAPGPTTAASPVVPRPPGVGDGGLAAQRPTAGWQPYLLGGLVFLVAGALFAATRLRDERN